MERNGIRGNTLNWFKNYLSLRSYRVKINNTLSDETHTKYGVPQGSKLGPILYIIYANEMLKAIETKTFAYADDTAIVVANNNLKEATEIMQKQLNIATKWCHDNGLIINAAKTKLMHIKPRHLTESSIELKFHHNNCLHQKTISPINVNDECTTNIEVVQSYKYLGVYVDNNFKWKTHVENVRKKLRKSAYTLYHLSNCATYSVLRQAYFSLAESYLRHGITAWGSATYCKTLQKTQNQILKILWKNYQYSTNTSLSYTYSLSQNITNASTNNNIYTTRSTNSSSNNNTTTYNLNENPTRNYQYINHPTNNSTIIYNSNENPIINNQYSNYPTNNNTTIHNSYANPTSNNQYTYYPTNNNTTTRNSNANPTSNNQYTYYPTNNNITIYNSNENHTSYSQYITHPTNNNTTIYNTNNNFTRNNQNTSYPTNNNTTIHNFNENSTSNNQYINHPTNNNTTMYNTNENHTSNNQYTNHPTNNNTTIYNLNGNPTINNQYTNHPNNNSTTMHSHHPTNNNTTVYNSNNSDLATKLNILNVHSLYCTTLANDFFNDHRFLQEIDHRYNTRRRAQGRYKVKRYTNEYGKSTLGVTLPNILNKIPIGTLNTRNKFQRKKLIKAFFITSQ